MAGAERAGEPHGRRRSAGRLGRGLPDGRDTVNADGRAPTAGPSGAEGRAPTAGANAAGPVPAADASGGAGHAGPTAPSRDPVGGARSDGGASAGARARGGDSSGEDQSGALRAVTTYMRVNPQVFVLLVICLVLGLGTFLAVVFGLLTAGSDQTTGEPSGAVLGVHLLAPATARLML